MSAGCNDLSGNKLLIAAAMNLAAVVVRCLLIELCIGHRGTIAVLSVC